ncbi:hypothetical protein MKX07_008527 [Trichoderma sp. CBMAI-0711]|nr:hypothetical protein MKX07_008527 [Trichoderma sp. CBMAI-0711]
MEYKLPQVDSTDRERWDWPFLKFGFRRDELFTTLHDRFNVHQLPLQDPMAFHRDVCESVKYSATLEEFYAQMEERRVERAKEMNEAFNEICLLIASGPWVLACPLCYDPETGDVKTPPGTLNDSMPQKWALFNYFSRSLSFDTLIRFFDGFVRDRRKKVEDRRRSADKALERLRREGRARRAAAAAEHREMGAASRTFSQAEHSQPESPHDASSQDTPTDVPRLSPLRSRQYTATHPSAAASSTARKRRSDEDSQGPKPKRRRESNESIEDDDDAVWAAAEHGRWQTQEPASRMRQADKRNRTDNDLGEQRNKRLRSYSPDSEEEDEFLHHHVSPDEQATNCRQRRSSDTKQANKRAHIFIDPHKAFYLPSEDGIEEEDENAHISVMDPQKAFYLPSEGTSEDGTYIHDGMPTLDPMVTQGLGAEWPAPNQHPMSTPDPMITQWPMSPQDPMSSQASSVASYHTCPEAAEEEEEEEPADLRHLAGSQISSQEESEGHEASDTTNEAASARIQKKKSRALHRQRVENRRSSRSSEESQTSPPQKKPRQKKRQERDTSAPVEQLLQSRRSSRRNAGQTLFFLADDATACVASSKRNI